MTDIDFTEEELLVLNEAVSHIEDHETWMFDVMDGKNLENAINKIHKEANPIIKKHNRRGE